MKPFLTLLFFSFFAQGLKSQYIFEGIGFGNTLNNDQKYSNCVHYDEILMKFILDTNCVEVRNEDSQVLLSANLRKNDLKNFTNLKFLNFDAVDFNQIDSLFFPQSIKEIKLKYATM